MSGTALPGLDPDTDFGAAAAPRDAVPRGAPAALKQNPWVESSNLGRLS